MSTAVKIRRMLFSLPSNSLQWDAFDDTGDYFKEVIRKAATWKIIIEREDLFVAIDESKNDTRVFIIVPVT